MTGSSHIENYDQSTYWTSPARNFRSSARLHLQHLLYQNTLGYLLEPAVEKAVTAARQPLKIADLACGNGIWLIDLHAQLAKNNITAQLDGFDINPVNFPAAAYLPASISLQQLDVLAKPLPENLLGAYDVVHIRAFASIVPDSNLAPILSVASSLLKPGGYLQWEENRGDLFLVEAPAPEISTAACDRVVQVLKGGLQAKGISNAWIDELDTHLAQFGLQDTRLLAHDKRKQDYKGWTEDYLMVWEEVTALFPPKAEAPKAPLSREAWIAMFAAAVKETEEGVIIHQKRILTAVGKKPLA
ncbi:hypothetical protein CBS63078_3260 [Aspergillus niger]|uniref:Methyltransferase domain-containing protein n=2 Tax=Aspergillus niger TaxID=5061 RepID=G3Y6B9_ASPNA|nr:hypothetical protein ASPNIDRAFT_200887 [Aspergillus niger ATCC 1015]KAI2866342.1 hypothetical protein CBS12448_1450 [Aspergillus niger]KAI2895527.1 hypothetical protein CBS13152_3595 [Aspergillus niger]KAI2916082.1 hypothetical protein CBS63078_3260 [Aspergillus niger]KAI2960922.1 hypothetical protein CBS147324_9974 [Aspergillus niger]